ncbi:UPF0223 family protein [Oceanobacillus sp. CAU 1775]
MAYQYPIDESWSTEEIVDVVQFFSLIEKAYESKVLRDDIIALYRRFKEIVPSKSEEKTLFKEFEQSSNYSAYLVVKRARETDEKYIKMY